MNPRGEDGFTLPELLMAIAILAIIVAPLTMSFITGLRVVGRVDQKFDDSRSSLISASSFANDVANAAVITNNTSSPCGAASSSANTVMVTFAWKDANTYPLQSANNKVSYVYDSVGKRLLRRYCANGGSANQSVAAVSLDAQPTVTCYNTGNTVNANCNTDATVGAVTRWVKMDVTSAANTPTPAEPAPQKYAFTLEGTRRSV
jgi:prepilin-type N-terminal cleavage/methylation domain-containing protein